MPRSTPIGLTSAEVEERRAQGLGNQVENKTSRTYRQIIEDNLFTFINTTLIGIGFILILLGQPKDALMSSGLAIINASIGIVQEAIAKRRLDRIALLNRRLPRWCAMAKPRRSTRDSSSSAICWW